MAHVKPEESDHSVWQGYTLPQQHQQQHQQHQQQQHHQQAPVASHPPSFDPNFSSAPLNLAYHGRPQKGAYRSLDLPSTATRPIPREGDGILTSSPPTLNSHHSYPSLKRAFNEDAPYGEAVHDFREDLQDAPKPTIQQDHRLLSFSRLPDKHTLLDAHGRVQQVDLSAQIHGMFFLSEMGTPGADGTVQPELTCYRRNLFQISGSVTAPRGSLSMISERGERLPVMSLEVAVSAIESVDGHSIKLIVIPWKTPPPNSPEVGPGQEHEPAPIPLLPYEDGNPDIKGDFAVYPIAYRRLQFRIATANNGRRRELQQHFVLHLDVIATLANGQKMNACETTTSPIVVRGRSPRNFQARKEIPLVGSSASRGQAPELHVVTTVASSRPVAAVDSKVLKPLGNLELPRGPFNFDASNLPPSPLQMRQQTYQSWNPSQHPSDHTTSGGTSNSYPPSNLGLGEYMHVSSNSDPNNLQTVGSMAPASTMPAPLHSQPPHQIRPQYHYHQPPNNTTSPIQQLHSPLPSNPAVRFIDSNPRPTKSPRHMAPSELPSNAYNPQEYSNARFAPTYSAPPMEAPLQPSPLTQPPLQQREYFPTTTSMSMSMQAWTTASDVGALYGATTGAMLPAVSAAHYDFGNEHGYVKSEPTSLPQQNYTWNPV